MRSDEMIQMMIELLLDEPPSLRSAEAAAMRERLRVQIAEIHARGWSVHIPPEWPVPTSFREFR